MMSNVINFLEKMGQDARLCHASQSEVGLVLAETPVTEEIRTAILARDHSGLNALLGQNVFFCMQFPVKEDDDEDTGESPARENEESASYSADIVQASAG